MGETLRYGIIGIGNMGSSHALALSQGKVKHSTVSAVCDTNPQRLEWAKNNLPASVRIFDNSQEMYQAGCMDAVLIAVPHYEHSSLAIQGFEAGLHVLVEKPAGVYTAQVEQMNAAAEKSGKVFGIMYNQRTNPVYQKARELVQKGELGEIKRVIWIMTSWYRSQSYYNSGGWRATWAGEGGGVLLNQDPHQLDLLQWICGMPNSVQAFMQYGKQRNIEVENDVTAYLQYKNGASGLFVTSTHESPGTNRLEISADRGKLVIEDNQITFWRLETPESEWNQTYQGGFGEPDIWKCSIPADGGGGSQHIGIMENFAQAVLHGTPLLAPGEEGILGLSISNAMHLSNWTGKPVDPGNIDQNEFYTLLQQRIAKSTFQKAENSVTLDVSGTH